jgi:hypothetical protein
MENVSQVSQQYLEAKKAFDDKEAEIRRIRHGAEALRLAIDVLLGDVAGSGQRVPKWRDLELHASPNGIVKLEEELRACDRALQTVERRMSESGLAVHPRTKLHPPTK